jgi:hypothetical protein
MGAEIWYAYDKGRKTKTRFIMPANKNKKVSTFINKD